MSNEDYRNSPGISQSELKKYLAPKRVAKQPQNFGAEAGNIGNAVHEYIACNLDRKQAESTFLLVDGSYLTKATKAICEANPWKTVVPVDRLEECFTLAKNLIDDWPEEKFPPFNDGDFEFCGTFMHQGQLFKGRLDYVSGRNIVDFKTTSDGLGFENSFFKYGYDIQAFHYSMIAASANDCNWDEISYFIAMVDKLTGVTGYYKVPFEVISFGAERWSKALVNYLGDDKNYTDNTVKNIEIPRWLK